MIKVRLRDKKDHFVTTIYKDLRRKLNIKPTSILLLKINDKEIIKIPNQDFHITIPKKLIKSNHNNVKIKILKVYDKKEGILRDKSLFQGENINFSAFVPKRTIFGNEIFILDAQEYIYVWYNISGGAQHIKIKRKFNAEKIAELMGFYFGDGNTSEKIRSFRLNNCEPSTLNHCLNILEGLDIPRSKIKIQIIYSSNIEIEEKIKKRCINYWADTLKLKKNQIVSVSRSKNLRKTLKHGSARIFFDNSIFVEIMLNGILKNFVEIIKNPRTKIEKDILKGFLRGLAAAEGSVTLTKLNSLSKIGFAYDPHSEDLKFYKKILDNLEIIPGKVHGNELLIYGINNFKIFNKMDLFKMHEKRKKKFDLGYKNHKFSN